MLSFLKSQDSFGEPVTMNYKGESSYKTLVGAIMSIAIKTFVLAFAVQQIDKVVRYDDADIIQVSFSKCCEFKSKSLVCLMCSIRSTTRVVKTIPSTWAKRSEMWQSAG